MHCVDIPVLGKWKVILSMGMQLTWPCGRALAVGVSYNLTHWQTIFQVQLFQVQLFQVHLDPLANLFPGRILVILSLLELTLLRWSLLLQWFFLSSSSSSQSLPGFQLFQLSQVALFIDMAR